MQPYVAILDYDREKWRLMVKRDEHEVNNVSEIAIPYNLWVCCAYVRVYMITMITVIHEYSNQQTKIINQTYRHINRLDH